LRDAREGAWSYIWAMKGENCPGNWKAGLSFSEILFLARYE